MNHREQIEQRVGDDAGNDPMRALIEVTKHKRQQKQRHRLRAVAKMCEAEQPLS